MVLTCSHDLCFEQKFIKSKKKKTSEIVIFTALKNHCMLHGRVFLMNLADAVSDLIARQRVQKVMKAQPLDINLLEQ